MADGPAIPDGSMGDHIAHMVRKLREEQRLPYTELAERLAKLGRPIPVLGLRRIERGERRVDVDDLVALAVALGTFPVRLAVPAGEAVLTEVYQGLALDTTQALLWFTGELPLATTPVRRIEEGDQEAHHGDVAGYTASSADINNWHRGGGEWLKLVREHQQLLSDWRTETMFARADRAALAGEGPADPLAATQEQLAQMAEQSASRAQDAWRRLLDHRRKMDQQGMILPTIPELGSWRGTSPPERSGDGTQE